MLPYTCMFKKYGPMSNPPVIIPASSRHAARGARILWDSSFAPQHPSAVQSHYTIAADCRSNAALQWRHNDHGGVSNHQHHGCLLNRLFRRRSKNTSKPLVCSTSLMASPISDVGGLSKYFYQDLWLADLNADVIGQSINRRGVA